MDAPVIAATLIVRDEARCIRRCLESVRPHVDRMVVLDTGSRDATMRLARRSGAQVHEMAWPGSFAAARNRALELADADWHLVIDADEWIAGGGTELRTWCAGDPARLGRVYIDSAYDDADADAPASGRSWITRLMPRGLRFTGRVHEQVASDLPRAATPLVLGHDGYRDVQIARKADRNRPLLLADLADAPGDPYILYQLGKDARMRDDHRAACAYFAEAISTADQAASWRHELVICYLQSLRAAGDSEAALALARAEEGIYADSPDLYFTLGGILLDRAAGDPVNAMSHWLPRVREAWQRCLYIGERPELEGSVAGRGSHLAARNLAMIDAQLAMLRR